MYNISYNVFKIFKTYSPRSQLFQPGVHSLCTEERFVFEDFCRLLFLSPSPSQPSIWKLTFSKSLKQLSHLSVCPGRLHQWFGWGSTRLSSFVAASPPEAPSRCPQRSLATHLLFSHSWNLLPTSTPFWSHCQDSQRQLLLLKLTFQHLSWKKTFETKSC